MNMSDVMLIILILKGDLILILACQKELLMLPVFFKWQALQLNDAILKSGFMVCLLLMKHETVFILLEEL